MSDQEPELEHEEAHAHEAAHEHELAHEEAHADAGPQEIKLQLEVPFGATQTYGSDWIAYAMNTEAPAVQGVDANLNPAFPQLGDEGETRLA